MLLQLVTPWGFDSAYVEDGLWVFDGVQYKEPQLYNNVELTLTTSSDKVLAAILEIGPENDFTDPRLNTMVALECECFCEGIELAYIDVSNEN